jgi:RecB family endonuclease NucS
VSGYVSLRKTGAGWEFESEAALEDFVWANLQPLFGLTPLKQQYCVSGQFCDLLAVGENKQLVVLELKNVEDRYIVQQLTRYYDALLEEKPFSEEVDYGQPARLVAIAPTFHRDNFTDRKYHPLSFQFLKFAIVESEGELYLEIKDIDTGEISHIEVRPKEKEKDEDIPAPPRFLLKIIEKCTEGEKEAIFMIRRRILTFDKRIKEIAEGGWIKYGRGKTKLFAELRFDSKRNSPAIFLWLPLVRGWSQNFFTARMRVWTDWKTVSDVGYIRKGTGIMISENEYRLGTVNPPAKLLPSTYYGKEARDAFKNDQAYRESHIYSTLVEYEYERHFDKSPLAMSLSYYMKLIGESEADNSLERIVDMALEGRREKSKGS